MPDTNADPLLASSEAAAHRARASFGALAFGSLGVVYGDIGTSPLYALKESLKSAAAEGALTRAEVLGVVSLILWALTIIVTVKYVFVMMRADNNGEGGTLTLMALAQRVMGHAGWFIPLLGATGAALFYGDAIITPAVSVLSALEGVKLVTDEFTPFILPISFLVLIGLFVLQSRGTAGVAAWFAPVMIVWFVILALGGLAHVKDDPGILGAISPTYGIRFLTSHGTGGLIALGSTFLAVTGAEALYADMGHFGRGPIRIAWLTLVFPSLALNYLGQGALVLKHPETLENPFFLLFPSWALLPMVVLATAATIIASQAVISGTYSLTQQAMQLGLLPRMDVRFTSELERGQIYVPRINWLLLAAVLMLVLLFRTSDALAAAYGIAVTGTMVISAVLAFFVVWKCWTWSPAAAALLIAPLLAVDLVFLAANLLKVFEGGWIPLAVGTSLLVLMLTWRRGTQLLRDKTQRENVPLAEFLPMLDQHPPAQVKGTAVFLAASPEITPTALLHSLKHYKVLHEQNVILTVETVDTPRAEANERVKVEPLSALFTRVTLRFGYMERPNIPRALALVRKAGLKFDIMSTSFFMSRRLLKIATRSKMPRWQDRLFIWMAGTANDATEYFQIPTGRAVEIGTQISI
ncbi:potassium transporter Kup [Methylobacterium sp. P31]